MHFIAATKDDHTEVRIRVDEIAAVSEGTCKDRTMGPGPKEMLPCLTVLLQNHQSINLIDIEMEELFQIMFNAAGTKLHVHRVKRAAEFKEGGE